MTKERAQPTFEKHRKLLYSGVFFAIVLSATFALTGCTGPSGSRLAPEPSEPPAPAPASDSPNYAQTSRLWLREGEVIDIVVESDCLVVCQDRSPGSVWFEVERLVSESSATGYDYDQTEYLLDQIDRPTFLHYVPWGALLYQSRRTEKSGETMYATAVRFIAEENGDYVIDFMNYTPRQAHVIYGIYEIGEIDYDEWEGKWLDYMQNYEPEQYQYEPLPQLLERPPTGGYSPRVEDSFDLGPYE